MLDRLDIGRERKRGHPIIVMAQRDFARTQHFNFRRYEACKRPPAFGSPLTLPRPAGSDIRLDDRGPAAGGLFSEQIPKILPTTWRGRRLGP